MLPVINFIFTFLHLSFNSVFLYFCPFASEITLCRYFDGIILDGFRMAQEQWLDFGGDADSFVDCGSVGIFCRY